MRDYQLLRSTKEQNIVMAHLANKQSLKNLELNSRILRLVQEKEARIEINIGADLKRATYGKPQDFHGGDHERLHYQTRITVWSSAATRYTVQHRRCKVTARQAKSISRYTRGDQRRERELQAARPSLLHVDMVQRGGRTDAEPVCTSTSFHKRKNTSIQYRCLKATTTVERANRL
jgi:hypothetical protein